ncbi:hypothetical protein FS837_002542 [Tulasnella sp. UAMH 9824]|nr:hypothetical protein FS837_002542 [Tulasnella sp. UAMH 9824]
MSEPTLNLSEQSIKPDASMEANRNEKECKDPKRTQINPRAILDSLGKWRIQPDTIAFNPEGTRKQGATADVELATLRPSSSKQTISSRGTLEVAVKKFRLGDNRDGDHVLASLAHEIRFMSRTNNPKIIRLVGFAENIEEDIAWIILDWATNGNVREFLDSKSWEIPELVSLIYDVSCGMQYLHSRNPPIRRGDLKSANILVNSRNRAVITDFGSARFLEELTELNTGPSGPLFDEPTLNITQPRVEASSTGTLITLTGSAWTLRWAAPELVNDTDLGSDVWAFAWICWEIMTGDIPFPDEPNDINLVLQLAMRNFELPSILTHEQLSQLQVLCGLMNRCWSLDVDGRPTADYCVSEIKRMGRIIPSKKHEEGSSDTSPVDLLLTLGHLDLKNKKPDGAMKRFDEALDAARSNQNSLREVRNLFALEEIRFAGPGIAHPKGRPGTLSRLQSEYKRIESSYIKARSAEAGTIYDRVGDRFGIANASVGMGQVLLLQHRHPEAETFYSNAREIYQDIGDKLGVAHAVRGLGEVQHFQDNCAGASAAYTHALDIHSHIEDAIGVASVYLRMGEVLQLQGRYQKAEASYIKARVFYDQIGHQLGVANATRELGDLRCLQKNYDKAMDSYVKAQKIYNRIGDQLGIANATLGIGDVQRLLRKNPDAEMSYSASRAIYNRLGCQSGIASAMQGLGDAQRLQNNHAEAIASYIGARDIYSRIGDQLGVANAILGVGDVQQLLNEYAQAEEAYTEAQVIYNRIGDLLGSADATRGLGDVHRFQNNYVKSMASYLDARDIYDRIGDQLGIASTILGIGDVQRLLGEYAKAEELYADARQIYRRIGDQGGIASASWGLREVQRAQNTRQDHSNLRHQVGEISSWSA